MIVDKMCDHFVNLAYTEPNLKMDLNNIKIIYDDNQLKIFIKCESGIASTICYIENLNTEQFKEEFISKLKERLQ